jgi:hypothetical protein
MCLICACHVTAWAAVTIPNLSEYAFNTPTGAYDPTGTIVPLVIIGIVKVAAMGAAAGAAGSVAMQGVKQGWQLGKQVKSNWDDGKPLTEINSDCIDDTDWREVGISALAGAVAPGLLGSGYKIFKSGRAISTLRGQATNTANRAQKIEGRVNKHKNEIKKHVAIQAGMQPTVLLAKCALPEKEDPCEK